MPLGRKASCVDSEMKVGMISVMSMTSGGMPSWVTTMLRQTLSVPRARRNGVATACGSEPRTGGRPAAAAMPE
ncbi:Uncharacterised protein [Mycobacteroides abscessus]|nr:Uncharacterised protein [Mycobacteroides abscessus]SIK42726.1 Uncharacterised protein [Mycobacteroides abscessus subsp. abscessus]